MSDGWAGAEVLHRVGVGILEGRKLSRFYRNITYSKLSTFSFLHDSGSNFFTCDGICHIFVMFCSFQWRRAWSVELFGAAAMQITARTQ